MKIINIYVGKNLLITFLMTLVILTFVMLSGNLIKVIDMLSKGLPVDMFLKYGYYLIPRMLGLTIPLALLTSTILVYSRLSAEQEISAMRASGISLWQIASPGLFLSILLSLFCLYMQIFLIPDFRYKARALIYSKGANFIETLLEPGRFIEAFDGYIIYIGSKEKNNIKNVHIYGLNKEKKLSKDIVSRSGKIVYDEKTKKLKLILYNASIEYINSNNPNKISRISGSNFVFSFDMNKKYAIKKLSRPIHHMDFPELFAKIQLYKTRGLNTLELYLEMHRRMALGLSPFAFLLLGMPFGIRTSRTETSVGLVISLILGIFFFAFLLLANSMKMHPEYHPEILIWIPNVLYQLAGLFAIHRIMKR